MICSQGFTAFSMKHNNEKMLEFFRFNSLYLQNVLSSGTNKNESTIRHIVVKLMDTEDRDDIKNRGKSTYFT